MKNLKLQKALTIITMVCVVCVLTCITIGGLTGGIIGELPKLGPVVAKATIIFIGTFCLLTLPVSTDMLKRLKA